MKILFLGFMLFPFVLFAQKVLQLEKKGSAKTQKISLDDEITYKLFDDDVWYTATLYDIKPEEDIIVFNNRLVRLEQIAALRFTDTRSWSSAFGKKLYTFAAGWTLFGIADRLIFNQSENRASIPLIAIPAATTLVGGWLIQRIFRQRTKKIGNKYRLRLLDLTISPIRVGP
jgi:hypothetical protein